jgi:glycine/D-amino acid oxidase-like deaminating enzyme
MAEHRADIVIFGAGIAGLWLLHSLKAQGYDVLLLETNAIGCSQTIASQGIIHSGLKYTLAGKVSDLARTISKMPDRWRLALDGSGAIDLKSARMNAPSQQLMIPGSIMGQMVKFAAKQTLGQEAAISPDLQKSGFTGSVIDMSEPVLDVPSVIESMAAPFQNLIRKIDSDITFEIKNDRIKSVSYQGQSVEADLFIFTSAAGNAQIAAQLNHDQGLKTQHRPLLMGMFKNAPFPLYAHFVGLNEKPVATITTHTAREGSRIWYMGGQVAEWAKEDNPKAVYDACVHAFKTYLPNIDISAMEFATLPIDRVEGASGMSGWMPDTPTIHSAQNALYAWPTKLTFAPMLADMVDEQLKKMQIRPSGIIHDRDTLTWPLAPLAQPPWETAQWTKGS